MIVNPDGSVTLTADEYDDLCDDSAKLNALERAGVDNWEWYDDALEEYRASKEEENE